ncbi:MAG TPA: hypothetical protein VMJ66_09090 [Geobacteraceae bacterium]|nr:hypothetical protein [Geobacteraceae bacterium]
MSEYNANSFDLLQAQQLLNILIPGKGSAAKEKPVRWDAPRYTSLSAGNVVRPVRKVETPVEEPVEESVAEPLPEMDSQKFDSWEECIAWCMSATRAEAAFVVDSQGFVIASRGRIPSHGFEGAGAELICSIEQLERIAPDAGKILCVDMDFDKRRIVGFVAAAEEAPPYVVGLVAPEPLRAEAKNRITQQIVDNLHNLD